MTVSDRGSGVKEIVKDSVTYFVDSPNVNQASFLVGPI